MKLDVSTEYVVFLKTGRKFAAKLTGQDGNLVVFESSTGVITQHVIGDDIVSLRKVVR